MRSSLPLALLLALNGCGSADERSPEPEESREEVEAPAPEPELSAEAQALLVDPGEHDFSSNPELLERLRSEPHAYLRFTSSPFASLVCQALGAASIHAPSVNLHGDAHVEQYAVTDFGRGVTDFDGATRGPGALDLVRMGVSLALLADAKGWERSRDAVLDALLEGYEQGLEPGSTPPEAPAVAQRIRATFSDHHEALLGRIERMMMPIDESTSTEMRAAFAPYVAQQLQQHELDPHFFDIVRMGEIDVGIGSALDHKVLFRVRGASDAASDDVILEAKQVRSLGEISCVQDGGTIDPLRVLLGESRIAYHPFPHLGTMRTGERVYWVHGWAENYRELDASSFRTTEELIEVVRDIGIQLGYGHINRIAAPLDELLRQEQRNFVRQQREWLEATIQRLAAATKDAWRAFAQASEPPAE